MASKASLKAFCALGCCYWFGEEARKKHSGDDEQFEEMTYMLQRKVGSASLKWEDSITQKQANRIHQEFEKVFKNDDENALKVGSMLLAVLDDIYSHVKQEKKKVLDEVISILYDIVRIYYEIDDNEWKVYASADAALSNFNGIIERL